MAYGALLRRFRPYMLVTAYGTNPNLIFVSHNFSEFASKITKIIQ